MKHPTQLAIFADVLEALAFIFIGPLPFVQMKSTWEITVISFGVLYFGNGLTTISSLIRAKKATKLLNFEQDLKTYMALSCMWTSFYYSGSFFGCVLGGIFVQYYGFRQTTLIFFVTKIVMIVLDFIGYIVIICKERHAKNLDEYEFIK